MKKKLFLKFFVLAVIGAFVTFTSCKDYDDDISRLDKELGDAKTELTGSIASQLAALKTELNTAIDGKVKAVADELAATKTALTESQAKLTALEAASATKEEVEAVKTQIAEQKAEILEKTVTLAAFNDFKADHAEEIEGLVARIDSLEKNGATKAELAALKTEITGMLSELQASLDALDVRLTSLEKSHKELMAKHDSDLQNVIASIAGLKAELDPRISTIETLLDIAEGKSGVLNGIADDLAAHLAKIGANADAIALLRSDLEAELADQLVLINANKTEIKAVKDDLAAKYAELVKADADLLAKVEENYDELDGKISLNKDAIDALSLRVGAIEKEIKDIKDSITALEKDLNIKIGSFSVIANSMITEVTFDYAYDDISARYRNLYFTTTPARIDYTFATGVTNAITFVKGQRLDTEGVTIMVKVSPANADLSKMVDKIKLIRSDANAQINNYVVATKAERATPLLTRATPTATGLWSITFELPTSSDLTEVTKLVKAPAPSTSDYLFALAIENTVNAADDAEDRFVISDFGVAIRANNVAPIYNLAFDAKNATDAAWTNHTNIKNRYGVTDPVSGTTLTDKTWAGGAWNSAGKTVADGTADDRASKGLLNVEVAKEFNVRITNPNVYGYYVALDKEYAVESAPSELIAWESYANAIEGLNTVYKADEVAKLKINSSTAAGDVIGFRVYAVNWDGTLVDPDGKSFYVGVGTSPSATLAFEQVIDAPMAAGATKATTILPFTPPTGVAVASADFAMTIGHSVNLTMTNIQRLDATDAAVTTWAATKKLQITGVIPANLEEGKTYTGTLTLKNTAGIPVQVTTVTLTKVLPTADLGITYKTNIHHDVDGVPVVYAYAKPDKTYDVVNALNVPAGMTNLEVANASTFPAASLPTWVGTTATVPVAEIGVPYLPAVAPGHGKIYDLTLSRNFGPVQYDATASAGTGKNYNLAWTGTPALKVEFRSYVQDLADWKFISTGTPAVEQSPVLKYGANVTGYALSNITALPPAGSVAALGSTTTLQDGRTFTVTGVKLWTGANFDVANEYFVPTLVGAPAATINFTAVITSVPASNVATKLEVTLKDNFGHEYTYVLPKVFDMTPN